MASIERNHAYSAGAIQFVAEAHQDQAISRFGPKRLTQRIERETQETVRREQTYAAARRSGPALRGRKRQALTVGQIYPVSAAGIDREYVVGGTGIEPVTPAV
jgi:hypothetical protein